MDHKVSYQRSDLRLAEMLQRDIFALVQSGILASLATHTFSSPVLQYALNRKRTVTEEFCCKQSLEF